MERSDAPQAPAQVDCWPRRDSDTSPDRATDPKERKTRCTTDFSRSASGRIRPCHRHPDPHLRGAAAVSGHGMGLGRQSGRFEEFPGSIDIGLVNKQPRSRRPADVYLKALNHGGYQQRGLRCNWRALAPDTLPF
jgi:hypothetical protein